MQLLSIEPKQALISLAKPSQLDLGVELLSKIESLPESEQAQLLALAAPKLQGEKLKRAFHMALHLETRNRFTAGLSLI